MGNVIDANKDPHLLWPGGIVPYRVNYPSTSRQHRNAMRAIATWNAAQTGFRLVEWDRRTPDYISFSEEDEICISNGGIGRKGGHHSITCDIDSTDGGSTWRWGSLTHEIGHAIGLFHEQQRADARNNWNLARGTELTCSFKPILDADCRSGTYRNKSHGTYDPDSIMHYPLPAGVTLRRPVAGVTVGQRNHLSTGDIAAATYLARRANATKFALFEISGYVRIRDDESGADEHARENLQRISIVLTEGQGTLLPMYKFYCGGEVRVELDVRALLNPNGNISINCTARLYEGTSIHTDDLEDTQRLSRTLRRGGNLYGERIDLYNDEWFGGDEAMFSLNFEDQTTRLNTMIRNARRSIRYNTVTPMVTSWTRPRPSRLALDASRPTEGNPRRMASWDRHNPSSSQAETSIFRTSISERRRLAAIGKELIRAAYEP